jgi:plasmid stability protein
VATITLRNVPDDIHAALRLRARSNNRSRNEEAISCLRLGLVLGARDSTVILAEIRSLRRRVPLKPVGLKWIGGAIRRGRP